LIPKADRTWTRKRIFIIIGVAIIYGIWFNYLDSAARCPVAVEECRKDCNPEAIGGILGDNNFYQPWNIIGHCLPGLFILLLMPKKVELFLAGVLISSAVMDSPMWGVMRIAHNLPLWHMQGGINFVETCNIWDWTYYYYKPIGSYAVWEDSWLGPGLPNAAMIFWSVVLRVILAGVLISWQVQQEAEGKEFSLIKKILLSDYRRGKSIRKRDYSNSEK
jgi:hypothetical protein